ncbi:MAG: four helix bundle protein, partial [Anaerolineae bacterium]|nr:four helix bundle protein [Anaerolineae bacterium]
GWIGQVPTSITRDPLWDFETYRKALFLSDLAWQDCGKLLSDPLGKGIAWQLIDSAGSVAANIEEGYGRGYGKDYARFLRIALGSAQETRGWYYRGRHMLEAEVVNHRMELINEIIAMLVVVADQQKRLK